MITDAWRATRVVRAAATAAVLAGLLVACRSAPQLASPDSSLDDRSAPGVARSTMFEDARAGNPEPGFARDFQPYAGLGAWVDVFNYAPQYQPTGHEPPITPDDLDEMHRRGVKTLFLQVTRWDDDSPGGYTDASLAGAFLVRAHELGMRVVGWYLPRFVDPVFDVIRAKQIVDFRSGAHRFDGLAVDIEYTEGETDLARRNDNLIRFSQTLRDAVPGMPIAAIMLSAVHLEVVNTNFWPTFPYAEIGSLYDVWMPMAYWTIRLAPYDDGYLFAKESIDRLRVGLGNPAALVAPIGGISDEMTDEHIDQFGDALRDTGAIGGSFYNWNTMAPGKQARVEALFARGAASALPSPPG